MVELPEDAVVGPTVRPANRSRDAGSGIHDDAIAQAAGFRGGTVAGNVHLDHFPPVLIESFGEGWFERGFVSMYFREPTTHLEPVRVAHAATSSGDGAAKAWVLTPDNSLVAEGEVGVGDYPADTSLRSRDRRPCDVHELDLLGEAPIGKTIDAGTARVNMARQHALLADQQLLPQPLDWYGESSPWGPLVACPSVAVDLLWSGFERAIRPSIKPAVGLYGAIELHHRGSPLLAETDYELTGIITDVSQSPRTEIFWAETSAHHDGEPVASLIMMIRLLRGAS